MSDESQGPTYTRQEPISVPVPAKERRLAIRYLDWNRCKKKLKKIKQQTPRLHIVYSFLLGITTSSGFSLTTFYLNTETKLPSWGYPLYALLFVFSLAAAGCFYYVDQKNRKGKASEIDDIVEDMEDIEKTFPPETQ